MADCTEAIPLCPQDTTPLFIRAIVYIYMGHTENAIADSSIVIQRDPKNADAYLVRATAFSMHPNTFNESIDDYTKMIILDPKNTLGYRLRGAVYQKAGDINEAIYDYSQAIKIDPECEEAYTARSKAYLLIGEKEKSDKDVEMANKLRGRKRGHP